jgi:hypothetical protein
MTDRLATLMHGEAESLEIPGAPVPEILVAGQKLRRRRTALRGAGVAALAVAVATTGAVALRGHGSTGAGPATVGPRLTAYAVQDTVFLGDGSTKATMPEVAQSLYYTSAGILVRTNKDGSSDGGAPFHFELVRADGTTTKLGVTLGEVAPSTDAREPYLAWATMKDGKIQVVVHDVSTDKDVATVDVPGTFSWGGWDAPPVSLSGDLVYVGNDDETDVVNWRTGKASTSALPASTFPEVFGERSLVYQRGSVKVVDPTSGKALLDLRRGEDDAVGLSPDGRFALVGTRGHTEIYDVASGHKVQVPHTGWGWSSTGEEVFRVQGSTMTTCGTTDGQCHDSSVPAVGADSLVRYAGSPSES